MKQFISVVNEIKSTLFGITLFFILLDTLVLFLVVYLFLALFRFTPAYAILPALGYFVYELYSESRISKVRLVEKFYPELNEKLRTAADYRYVQNEIVDSLHTEVIEEMRKVAASSFFNRKETLVKVAAIILLCFTIVGLTILNINFGGFKDKLSDLIDKAGAGREPGGTDQGDVLADNVAGGAASKDIFGKKSIAKLGDKDIEVELRPSSFEFIIRESEDMQEGEEFSEQFPGDVTGVESTNYLEKIPGEKDKQELIKRYFKKLTEG